jgi:DNA (cytosine-5)-methyltransferase 1
MKRSFVTVTDQFCGAGGSSLGARAAGAEIKLALNHWQLAIKTHNTNFPEADHDCTDISACNPRRYPFTDILITSPECTNHSLAKGKKRSPYKQDLFGNPLLDPAEERSRATMWDVPRFAEYHDYNLIIVENVVDAANWRLFDSWLHAMHALDYTHQIVYFNSMFAHPTPQSRDRMYVVFSKRQNPAPDLAFTPLAYCAKCGVNVPAAQAWKRPHKKWGRYERQYVYRCPSCAATVTPYYHAAANAIDWSLPIECIGDREKPLKERTLARIRAGLEKFAGQHLLVETNYSHAGPNRVKPATDPWPTQTGQQSQALVITMRDTDSKDYFTKSVTAPLSTVTASAIQQALIQTPFLFPVNQSGDRQRFLTEPHPTQTGSLAMALVVPWLMSYYGTGQSSEMTDPVPTVTGLDRHALVMPQPFFLGYANGDGPPHPITDPLLTVHTENGHGVVQPTHPPRVEDCGFRMLQPHEIGAAMAFPDDYVVLGNKRERVKQYGNAVTPPVMQMILERCVATLAGKGMA